MKTQNINILVTLDQNYVPYLNVMLFSLLESNPDCWFDVYWLHTNLCETDIISTIKILENQGTLHLICADSLALEDAPTTSRYPKEIYYRIFAAQLLPQNIDRILYLDPDLIINGSILQLYTLPMEDYYFAAASHTGPLLRKVNGLRLDMEEDAPYINSGVMMMNLERLRQEQNPEEVFSFIEKRKSMLILPDQDVISSLYGSKIYALDTFRYNMTESVYQLHVPFEKDFNLDWIKKNAVIIHYCGRNKPWKENYLGQLNMFYHQTVQRMKEKENHASII